MNTPSPASRLLLVTYSSFVVLGFGATLLNVSWIYIQKDFDLSVDSLGLLVSVVTAASLVISFASGRIIARIGLASFILGGCILTAVGLLAFALATAWWQVLAFIVVQGTGANAVNVGVNGFAAAHYPVSRLNWLHAWFGVGSTLGPLMATTIIVDWGQSWHWAYALGTVLQIAVTISFFSMRRHLQAHPAPSSPAAPRAGAPLHETLLIPAVWFSMGLFFLHASAQNGGGQLSNTLLVEGRHMDPKTIGIWISLYWGSLTVGRFLLGGLAERFGSVRLLRASMLGTALGAALIAWQPVPIASAVGLMLMGFSSAAIVPTLTGLTIAWVGTSHASNTIGFQMAAGQLGSALLLSLATLLAKNFSLEVIGPFLMLNALATFTLHEVFVYWRHRRTGPATGAD